VLQPLLTMLVFTLFFGRLAKVPSDGVPYALSPTPRSCRGRFFATGLTMASNSLVGSANLITKVYFPRLTIPLATVLAGTGRFRAGVSRAVRADVVVWRDTHGSDRVASVCSPRSRSSRRWRGLWLSALNVQFRDVRHVVPFLTQLWMFATPIAYRAVCCPRNGASSTR
jgi:lipopolysaccharide transport system permease protein